MEKMKPESELAACKALASETTRRLSIVPFDTGPTAMRVIHKHNLRYHTTLQKSPNFFFRGFTPESLATSGAGNAVGSSTSPNSDWFTAGRDGSFQVTDLSEFAVPGREP